MQKFENRARVENVFVAIVCLVTRRKWSSLAFLALQCDRLDEDHCSLRCRGGTAHQQSEAFKTIIVCDSTTRLKFSA